MEVHVKGNPDLKPETSYNFDIGLEAENNHGGSGKVTYFHSKYNELIALKSSSSFVPGVPPTMVVTSVYENINTAEIQGAEAELKQKLGKYFTLRGTYTYTDAKDGDGARLEGRDRQKFSLQLNYDDAEHGWSGSLWNDWHRGYWGDAGDGLKNHSASVLNCVVSKKLGGGNIADSLENDSAYIPLGMEYLAKENPEVIFIIMMGNPQQMEEKIHRDLEASPAWAETSAVKNGRVHILPYNLFTVNPGVQAADAMKLLYKYMYEAG